ncbi:uncharacterized protein LOC142081279 [Calonectris borealis]|uniref:uncharacterized protein LOC142081279 n=1 Tax=Calonectris borealis TaxID=1323832 RepID=UPI003F4B29FE
MGHGGSLSADTSSELLENQPSTTDMEELAGSLMESLDITQICLDLLGKLKDSQDSGAPVPHEGIRTEYPVCLQCRRCLTGSEPAAEEEGHTLAACLRTADILVHEEDMQLEMGLGLELAVGGEPVYVWEITQRLPEIPPERLCEKCKAPLPRGPGDSESLQAWFAVPEAQGTPAGQMRPDGQDASCSDTSSAELQLEEDGQEESLPSVVPTWPLSPGAPDRLQGVGEEPLPWVGYKGLGRGLSLQRVRRSWTQLKASVRKSVETGQRWLRRVESSDEEEDETLPFDLRFKVDALFHAMGTEA